MKKRLISLLLALIVCIPLVCLTGTAAIAEWNVYTYSKIQLHTFPNASASNDVPYVLQNAQDFQVRMVTDGLMVTSWVLTDAAGNPCYGVIQNQNYVLTVNVAPIAANALFAPGTTAIVNGVASTVYVSPDGRSATVQRIMTPRLVCPVIWHDPTDETHDEGGTFSFVATASAGYASYQWYLRSPDGVEYRAEEMPNIFTETGFSVENIGTGTRFNLFHVRRDLNNWSVWCVFSGPGGSASTKKAMIHVTNIAPVMPVPTIQIIATPEPTPIPTPVPTPAPTPMPTPEPIIIEWEERWTSDAESHWHKSADPYSAEISGKNPHDFEWSVIREATRKLPGIKTGVCPVCGYTAEETVEYVSKGFLKQFSTEEKVIAGAGVAAVIAAIAGISAKVKNSRKKRKRRAAKARAAAGKYEKMR